VRARLGRVPRIVWIGLALVAIQVGLRAWALSGAWFYFDDLAFMSRALNQHLDGSYLFESYGGHLMPGAFVVVWGLTKVAAYDWWAWASVLLVLQALAGIGMLRLLRSLIGDRPVVLVLLATYLASAVTLPAGIWFAAGVNQLPLLVALPFGLHAHVQYLRTRSLRSLFATLGWTAFGLLFYEKTALLFGVYALVAFCWFCRGRSPQRLRELWSTYRTGILAHAVVAAGYLALYAAYGLNFSPTASQTQPLTPIAWNLVFVALLPALVGGPVTWQPVDVGSFADPSQFVQLLSWLAIGGLVAYAYRTRTSSARAWSLVGLAAGANVLLLASARANIVGPDIAREYRYQTESAALFVISAALALFPLVGAPEQNVVREGVPRTYEQPRLVVAVTTVVVLLSVFSSWRYAHVWDTHNPTRDYYDKLSSGLARAKVHPVPLVDAGLPQNLLWSYRFPENTYSHVFRNLHRYTSYPRKSLDRLYMFDDKGRLSPVVVPTTRTLLPSIGCGYSMKGESRMVLPLNGPVSGGGWWVRMGYYAKEPVRVEITAGGDHHRARLPAGLHSLFFTAAGEEFNQIVLEKDDAPADLCVASADLGFAQPGNAGS